MSANIKINLPKYIQARFERWLLKIFPDLAKLTILAIFLSIQDPMAMIRKLVNFIGVKVDEELLNGILISTSFKAMKQREGKTETLLFAENYSMYRKGTTFVIVNTIIV